jgi:predicted XRE-type DNA-binding protein
VVAVTTWNVTAKRWKHGWELHIDGVGVTQSRTLADADRMVRDYIATMYDTEVVFGDVIVSPELGDLGKRAQEARLRTKEAEEAQLEAAQEASEVARELRAKGLSVTDTAKVLGVSRGRVSQLVSRKAQKSAIGKWSRSQAAQARESRSRKGA